MLPENTAPLAPSTSVPPPAAAGEPAPATRIARGAQNIAIQDDVTRSYRILQAAKASASLRQILAESGYDEAEFAAGLKLVATCAAAVGLRYESLGSRALDQGAFMELVRETGNAYKRFRKIARSCFSGPAQRKALTVTGVAPRNVDLLVSQAQSAYNVAATAPYADKLGRRGYPAEKLKGMVDRLDALVTAASEAAASRGDAIAATAERDTAYEALRNFMTEFKGVARAVLADTPGALNTLGL